MGFLAGIFVVWGLVVSVCAPFAPGGLAKLMVFAIGWAPTAALIWFALDRSKRRQAAHKKMLDDVGVLPGRGFDHTEDGTGIAINRDQRVVGVLNGGAYRTYGYEKLREWAICEERAGRVIPAFGVANGIAAAGASARMENRVPGGDVNPYLALAAMLAGGLHGVERGLELEPAVTGNAYASDHPRVPSTLRAAREAFTQHGAGASLEDVARRAGVGVGTLYRNFPTREALIEAVYVDEVVALEQAARDTEGLEPWEALRTERPSPASPPAATSFACIFGRVVDSRPPAPTTREARPLGRASLVLGGGWA